MKHDTPFVGIDLGGTSLLAVVADATGKVLGTAEADTPHEGADPAPVVAEIAKVVHKAAKKADVKVAKLRALGLGAPGSVDLETGFIAKATNLQWLDVPLARQLEDALDMPSYIANDVQVAVMGEHAYGAARGARSAVAIWVGTGIGGGILLDGQLFRGAHGAAGEIGHMLVLPGGPVCGCGKSGCVEALASRTAIAREVEAAIAARKKSIVPKIMAEKNKDKITSSVLFAAARAGDKVTLTALENAQKYLAILVGNLLNVIDPQVVVVGGGVVEKFGDEFVAPIRQGALAMALARPGEPSRIVASELGDLAGALGATVWARMRVDGGFARNGKP